MFFLRHSFRNRTASQSGGSFWSLTDGGFRGNCFEFAARCFRKEYEHHYRCDNPERGDVADRRPMRTGETVEHPLGEKAERAAGGAGDDENARGGGSVRGGEQFGAVGA